MHKNIRRSDCPISFGLDIFGDKWTLLILRDILFYRRVRFSDFAPQERIATNVLADRLAKLEDAGLINKRRDDKLKNQYIYSVTEKGAELLPILIEMTLWGLRHDEKSLASNKFLQRIANEKERIVREIMRSVSKEKFTVYREEEMGIRIAT